MPSFRTLFPGQSATGVASRLAFIYISTSFISKVACPLRPDGQPKRPVINPGEELSALGRLNQWQWAAADAFRTFIFWGDWRTAELLRDPNNDLLLTPARDIGGVSYRIVVIV
jgi:hypothetical protein